MFKLRRKKPADDKLKIAPALRQAIATWLIEHGHSDPAEVMQRGWLVDLALDFNLTTAKRDVLVDALRRTRIPAQFSISKLPLQLTTFVLRLGHDGLLVAGNPIAPTAQAGLQNAGYFKR